MTLSLTIPGEPVAKGRPRVVRVGAGVRGITPAKTRDWTAYAVSLIRDAWTGAPLDEAVSVRILGIKSRPKRLLRKKDPDGLLWRTTKPDADNVAKAVLDAIVKAGVIRDDTLVVQLEALSLFTEREGAPRVEFTLAPVRTPTP